MRGITDPDFRIVEVEIHNLPYPRMNPAEGRGVLKTCLPHHKEQTVGLVKIQRDGSFDGWGIVHQFLVSFS